MNALSGDAAAQRARRLRGHQRFLRRPDDRRQPGVPALRIHRRHRDAAVLGVHLHPGSRPARDLREVPGGAPDEARAEREAEAAAEHLSATIALLKLGDIEVLGPSPAFVYRLKDEFRFEVTLKGRDLHRVADGLPRGRGWSLDVDPM